MMSKYICIRCNKPTQYDQSTTITFCLYIIEGSGQLCEECFTQVYPVARVSSLRLQFPSTHPTQPKTTEPRDQIKNEFDISIRLPVKLPDDAP